MDIDRENTDIYNFHWGKYGQCIDIDNFERLLKRSFLLWRLVVWCMGEHSLILGKYFGAQACYPSDILYK